MLVRVCGLKDGPKEQKMRELAEHARELQDSKGYTLDQAGTLAAKAIFSDYSKNPLAGEMETIITNIEKLITVAGAAGQVG